MYLHTFAEGLLYGGSEKEDQGNTGIIGEFSSNGVDNKVPMKEGVICMARGEGKDSGYGQFFILTEDNAELFGDYAAFGRLTDTASLEKILSSIKTDSNGKIIDGTAPKILDISRHDHHH